MKTALTVFLLVSTLILTFIFTRTTVASDEQSPENTVQFEYITLGATLSRTGKYSTDGEQTKLGYDLALQLINDAGGIKIGEQTYRLKIKYYDDESSTERGAELAEKLIIEDGINFMLGPYSSALTTSVARVTEKYSVPLLEGNGASSSLFENGYRYLFGVLSTSDQYLGAAIDLAVEMAEVEGRPPNSLKVAMAFENDPFSQDTRKGVLENINDYGMEIVADDRLPPDLSDMTPTLIRVRNQRPDLLIVSGHAKGAITAIRQLNEQDIYVPMLVMTHCDAADLIRLYGAGAEHTICAAQWSHTLPYKDELFGSAKNFSILFEESYGYPPAYQAAQSAAAVQVYAAAFEAAQTLDKEKVRDVIASTNMETFFGQIKFDETGKNIAKPMVLFQILDGEYKVVFPTAWAAEDVVYPRPRN